VEGLGTFAAVDKPGSAADHLVRVNPVSGQVLEDVGAIGTYSSVYGLAGAGGSVYGFDASGAVVEMNLETAAVTVILPPEQGVSWWGAGVTTRGDQN